MCGLVEELFSKRGLGIGSLSHYQQSACILVDTMHQSYFRIVRIVTSQVLKMPCYSIYQCTGKVAATRMDHHTSGFIDDHQVIVFVHHIQRYILCLNRSIIMRTVQHQRNHIARTYLIITLYRFVVYVNKTSISRLLYTVATGMLLVFDQVLVDTNRHLPFVHLHTKVFV